VGLSYVGPLFRGNINRFLEVKAAADAHLSQIPIF
jgi:hypothetical protein